MLKAILRCLVCLALLLGGQAATAQTAPLPPAAALPEAGDILAYDTQGFWDLLHPAQAFDCSRKTCGQIRSCAEACYKLQVCGHSERDGDGDGIPCESLCSRRCP